MRRTEAMWVALLLLLLLGAGPAVGQKPASQVASASKKARGGAVEASIAEYYAALERMGLIDIETGTQRALSRELEAAEALLHAGAAIDAAVALYAIVESPRFDGFGDFVAYQNAEYYLGVALAMAGAYDSALGYFLRSIKRGTSSMYFAPAHRWAVDIALEVRDYKKVLDALEGVKLDQPLPPEASGERAYLRARIAYAKSDFRAAEGQLTRIGKKSRLFSSALYLRGVIRTRRGDFRGASEALCEIADTSDDDEFTFVIDERYYTIKDLARLGLGRIAHEQGEYDDAYYHYFQIPDDSDSLPSALFEAAWSMYQQRDLAAARDLLAEFMDNFPTSPLGLEARLLAGYIELADCQFDAAHAYYDKLVAEFEPIVAEINRIRRFPERRAALLARAIERWRDERADPTRRLAVGNLTMNDRIIGLLRLDPGFVRLHEAVQGLHRAAGEAPHVVRAWSALGRRLGRTAVGQVARQASIEEEDADDANGLLEDIRRLGDELARARTELRRGLRWKTLPKDAAEAEGKRLDGLERALDALEARALRAARQADAAVEAQAAETLGPAVAGDLRRARALAEASRKLRSRLGGVASRLAKKSLDQLYWDTRRVLDKARLGKIDAIIGQKRRLDIEVQDLAIGRWPAELRGRLWEESLIGDDEEYWPFEGEYWSDEYEGWR